MRASKQSVFPNKHNLTTTTDDSMSTASGYKRRRPPLSRVDNGMLDLSGATTAETSDFEKLKLDTHRPPSPNTSYVSSHRMLDSSSYFDSDLIDYYPHRLENEIAHITPSTYDNRSGIRNRSYDEQSIDRNRVPRPAPRRPNLNRPYDAGSMASSVYDRPAPKESAM